MSGYRYDFGKMYLGADDLVNITNRIDELTTELETNTAAAYRSWTGEAQKAYDAEFLVWNDAIAQMRKGLGQSGLVLGNITDNSVRTENRQAAAWQGLGKPA